MGLSAEGRPGGNPKYLHQDSAYFSFSTNLGAIATLSYAVDVSAALDNGPLHVVPGSHRLGHVPHVDTPSHLGVPASAWSFRDALCIDGATIGFHWDKDEEIWLSTGLFICPALATVLRACTKERRQQSTF